MARIKIRHLVSKPGRRGTIRYFWAPSPSLRKAGWKDVRVAEDTGREVDAIREAEEINARVDAWRKDEETHSPNSPVAKPHTMNALIHAYRQDVSFTRLAKKSKRGYNQCLDKIEAWGDGAPVAAITPKRIKTFYQAMSKTPASANATIRVMRVLLQFAISEDWIESNPAREIRLTNSAKKGKIWSREAVDYLVAAADAAERWSIGTSVMLNEWCGQRQGDVLAWRWDRYTTEGIEVKQSKTGAETVLPVDLVPHLVERLEAEKQRAKARAVTSTHIIINEATGQPYVEDTFRHDFAEIRAWAAMLAEIDGHMDLAQDIRGLWFMHLRHTAITRMAEEEIDNKLIASITGHSLKTVEEIIDRYMVRTKKMARKAFTKRLEGEQENNT